MIYFFSNFELDDRSLELRKDGQRVAIEPKPLRLLLDLVAHAPLVRSHEELLQVVWAQEIVTAASLTRAVSALRRALGRSSDDTSVIETVRGRGYRIQAPIERVVPGSGGTAAPTAWQEMFVGREDHLNRLEALLVGAEQGRGAIALLTGEPGIGKTRTAEVLGERALSRGAEVYWGRGSETPGAPPHSPWSQVLRSYVEAHPERDFAADIAHAGNDFAVLLRESHGENSPRSGPPTDDARFALYERITEFIRHTGSHAPLLLLFDDLQWMDEGSQRMLSFLARHVGSMKILVVCMYRSEMVVGRESLDRLLAELVSLPHVEPTICLEGLAPSGVFTLLAAALGEKSAPELVDAIYDRTDGNPFFVRELVRQAVAAGGALTALTASPASVRQMLAHWVHALDPSQRAILEVVAVVGRETPLLLLTRVTQLSASHVLDVLQDLSTANLLELDGDPAPRTRFVHSIARQALFEGLHPSRRIELHGMVADALADGSQDRRIAEIAHHYVEAAPLRGIEPGLRYVSEAADGALSRLAPEEAIRLLERGLDLLELDSNHDSVARGEILIALARSLEAAGRRSDAKTRYGEAAELARSIGAPLLFVEAALGWTRHVPGHVVLGRWEVDAIAMLDEALDQLGEGEPALRLELIAALIPKLSWAGQRGIERAQRLSREGIEQARTLGLDRLETLCVCRRHLLLWYPSGLEERLVLAREAVARVDAEGDPLLALEARFLRIVDLLEFGEAASALEDIDYYERLASRAHQPNLVIQALTWRNARAHSDGRIAEMRDGIERGLQLARVAKVPHARGLFLVQKAVLDWTQDDCSQLDPLLESIASTTEAPADSWHAFAGWVAAEKGDLSRAADHLAVLARKGGPPVSQCFDGLFVAAAKSMALARLGDIEGARELYPQLLPFAQRHVVGAFGTILLGSVLRYLGLLAGTLGRYDEAERHFEEARAANWRTGAAVWAAHTLCDHAEVLMKKNGPGSKSRALRLLDHTTALTESSEILGISNRVEALQLRIEGISPLKRRPGVA